MANIAATDLKTYVRAMIAETLIPVSKHTADSGTTAQAQRISSGKKAIIPKPCKPQEEQSDE